MLDRLVNISYIIVCIFDISEILNERDGICVTQHDQYQQNTRAAIK